MEKIKLGVIRVDTHAYYYGIMLDDYDSLLLMKNNYVAHHYASFIYNAETQTAPQVDGFEITAVYDDDIKAARDYSTAFYNKPKVCSKLTDMIPLVDAVMILNCNFGGEDHLEKVTPFLEAGVPMFIDKPFAPDYKDAKAIVELARKNNAPIFNASILSYVPAATMFKNRFQEIATQYWPIRDRESGECEVNLGVIKGLGGAVGQETNDEKCEEADDGIASRMAYLIHGISLALNLFGTDVEYVESQGDLPLEYLHIHMFSGADVMVINSNKDRFPEECSFFASAYSMFGAVHSGPIGDPQFLGGGRIIMEKFQEMLQTGKPPVDYDIFVKHVAVADAGWLAHKTKERVYLEKFMD